MKRRTAATAITLVMLAPSFAFGLGLQPIIPTSGPGSDCNGQGGCQSICDLAAIAQNVLDDGIFIAIFLSAILFAWAGWEMVVGSSSGNTRQRNHGKRTFWYVTVGLVLIICAWLIVSVIMSALTNNSNWNVLCTQSLSTPPPPLG